MKPKNYHLAIWLTVLCACSEKETTVQTVTDIPVDFEVSQVDTRAGYRDAELDLDKLKGTVDFGVYAYYTGKKADDSPYPWNEYAKNKSGTVAPNFMYNQQVGWNSTSSLWEYTPLKYWPNGTGEARDEWGTGLQREPVSFFAYAPHVELGTIDTSEPNDPTSEPSTGIIAINGSQLTAKTIDGTECYAPTIDYRRNAGRNVDLLWATPQLDWLKPSVNAKVPFTFHHALATIKVTVQRVYDDYLPGDPAHKPDNATDTKIFVGHFSLTGNLYSEGRLRLDDGSWTALPSSSSSSTVIQCEGDEIHAILSGSKVVGHGTTEADLESIQDMELDEWNTTWNANPDGLFTRNTAGTGAYYSGVTEEPRLLYSSPTYFYIIPLGEDDVKLTPRIVYSFVTQDDALELDYLTDSGKKHRYSRITHDITSPSINLGKLEGGKRYVLNCLIGVEHVSFELVSVEDWDFPLRFITDMSDIDKTSLPKEKVLDEE